MLVALLLAPFLGTDRGAVAQVTDPDWTPPRTVYIPETGHAIDGYFLDLWRESGGFNTYGNPITSEMTLDNGHIVQYYEYARFEYWPEGDQFGNVVMVGDIGQELRPITVRRFMPAVGLDAKDTRAAQNKSLSATREMLAVTQAWLPLKATDIAENSASWRYVPETGHSVANGFKSFWEATGEVYYLGNPLTEEYSLGGVVYQVFEHGQLAWETGTDVSMVPLGTKLAERYEVPMEAVARGDLPAYDEELFIPPVITPGRAPVAGVPGAPKTIVVSIGEQALWALEGNDVVMESTYVSTGKPKFDTPTGTFYINSKVPVQDMEGIIGGEYYNVASVPDVMYFTNVGHAIHGTYWHDNFGQVMSHGCVNVPMGTSTWLYEWTPMGTPVVIVP